MGQERNKVLDREVNHKRGRGPPFQGNSVSMSMSPVLSLFSFLLWSVHQIPVFPPLPWGACSSEGGLQSMTK